MWKVNSFIVSQSLFSLHWSDISLSVNTGNSESRGLSFWAVRRQLYFIWWGSSAHLLSGELREDSYMASSLVIWRRACRPTAPAGRPVQWQAGKRVQRWGWVWCSAAWRLWGGFERSAPGPQGGGSEPPRWGRVELPVAGFQQTELPLNLEHLLNVKTLELITLIAETAHVPLRRKYSEHSSCTYLD